MCRHAAWLGPPRSLASLIFEPEHGLLPQAYAPRMQRFGSVNADGFGVGWYDPSRLEPVRYRRSIPIWADANLPGIADVARSSCLMAAVRSATVGMPIEESATAPFSDGVWLLSHNGRVRREAVALMAAGSESACDSAWLASAVFTRLREGMPVAQALPMVVRSVAEADPGARLNFLVSGGAELAATTWGDTLFAHLGQGVLIASEPLDDRPGWQAVPDRNLLLASPDGVLVTPIH
ncbi:ergothioneine biosynthesis protein EgtC [Planotetraspora kaengkrachanensis]|uniref:Gamma-glutamyl-hercynylcysteine sulfoxide hydrolase n=1 Tax=Planotetraspora kaengkrachanensis TaxID=575193 RepID=A0A8J3M2A6_9ACTN|nr:ergothioneine biosynthesis protein EgtC [Planotetraspora kaengkrachanensis]GIG78039.1 gamma-glutamyl-hercynylcysteine sulfoxide hydrolase [Planotetraspora kaengkrachanensis]